MVIVSVYDRKAELYIQPFSCINVVDAYRQFANVIKQGNSQIAEYPEDFELIKLAEFNKDTGEIKIDRSLICQGNQILNEMNGLKEMREEMRNERSKKESEGQTSINM